VLLTSFARVRRLCCCKLLRRPNGVPKTARIRPRKAAGGSNNLGESPGGRADCEAFDFCTGKPVQRELCAWMEPTGPNTGSLSRERHTQHPVR
jgi:hypothetical protein